MTLFSVPRQLAELALNKSVEGVGQFICLLLLENFYVGLTLAIFTVILVV